MASIFSDLLHMANQQPDSQRLLFLFASVNETNKSRKREDKKGLIDPTMVVDLLPDEIRDFSALVTQADGVSKKWDFVFIASLSGTPKKPPSSEEAQSFLDNMTNDVVTGNNIHRYVVLDRNESPIELSAH